MSNCRHAITVDAFERDDGDVYWECGTCDQSFAPADRADRYLALEDAARSVVDCVRCSDATGTLCAAHRPALRAALDALRQDIGSANGSAST